MRLTPDVPVQSRIFLLIPERHVVKNSQLPVSIFRAIARDALGPLLTSYTPLGKVFTLPYPLTLP
jgi:hypothetical protein